MSLSSIARTHCLPSKEFEKQYKDHLSGFREWDQKDHAEKWTLFERNIGEKMSIDEVAVTDGELYTVLTNKTARGRKGALAATIEGTKASDVIAILSKIPKTIRDTVKEVTLDMSNAMEAIVRSSFANAMVVIDRFHVQQLVSQAVQDVRIDLRRAALKEENEAIKKARVKKKRYEPETYENGDTKKQLLARSHLALFKPSSTWSDRQKARANILFRVFPQIESAYHLSMMFRNCYETSRSIPEAKKRFRQWYKKVREKNIDSFLTAADSIRLHEDEILNYFVNRSTNASAESFNAKLKGFRQLVRGVRDVKFFLFRVAKLYA